MDNKQRKQYEMMVLTPIRKVLPALAIPTTISMMITMVYNLVDAYFVGKLGTSASAAIGILVSVQSIFQAIGFMCGHGSGSHVSRLLGEQRKKQADIYASTAFYFAMCISTLIAIICLIFITPMMRLLGSTETILPFARIYGFYILISGPALAVSCVLNNLMRYEGKASLAMIGLVSGGVLNMIGDPIFMFGMHMGIHGAGLSTALSQYISLGILYYMFASGKTITTISIKKFKPISYELSRLLGNGFPSFIRQVLNSVATMTLNIASKPYGDAAIAAMTIVGRLGMFFGASMIGIGQGYQPIAAYNYGAKKYKRIREGFFFTWSLGEVILGLFAILGLCIPHTLVSIFRDDPEVIEIGVIALRCQSIATLMMPFSVTCNMMFQSIGESKIASFLATLRSGLYYIPILIILPRFIGITGITSAQMISDIMTTLTCGPFLVHYFRRLPKHNETVLLDESYKKLTV